MANPNWIKGKSANPKGRPTRGETLNDLLKFVLWEKDENGKRRRENVARKVVALAEAGNMAAVEFLWDRLEGKVPLPIQHGGAVEQRYVLEVRFRDDVNANIIDIVSEDAEGRELPAEGRYRGTNEPAG